MAVIFAIVALIVAAISLLALIATMRETVLLRGDVHALTQVITKPPDPALYGKPIPAAIRDLESRVAENVPILNPLRITGFLSADCGSCVSLVEGIASAANDFPELRRTITFVVSQRPGQASEVSDLLDGLPFSVHYDINGVLSRESDVRGTPMLAAWLPAQDGTVTEYVYGGSSQWILDRMSQAVRGGKDTQNANA